MKKRIIRIVIFFALSIFSCSAGGYVTLLYSSPEFVQHLAEQHNDLFLSADSHIPMPQALFILSSQYHEVSPIAFQYGFSTTLFLVSLSFLLVLISTGLFRFREKDTSHGSAEWGSKEVLNEKKMLGSREELSGVVLGRVTDEGRKRGGELIIDSSDHHVFVCAPTRMGKGVGVVKPTLYTWKESVFVLDIKGELFQGTSKFRSTFSQLIYFSPSDSKTNRFNPLLEVRRGAKELLDVRRIVEVLTDPKGTEKDDIWLKSARQLLEAIALHVLYATKEKSIPAMARFIYDGTRSEEEMLIELKTAVHFPNGETHKFVYDTASKILSRTDKERSGIIFSAQEALSVYRDPTVARALEGSDISLSQLCSGAYPVSFYFCVGPNDLSVWSPLIRLMFNQIVQTMCEEHSVEKKHRLLMLLDEFPALGKMMHFESQLAYVAGYGVKVMMVAQGLPQLKKHYGEKNEILSNAGIRLFFTCVEPETSEYISRMVGQKTEIHKTRSHSGRRTHISLLNTSVSEHKHSRNLLNVDELLRLQSHEAVLLLPGECPLKVRKILYYEDKDFSSLSNSPVEWNPQSPCPYGPQTLTSEWNQLWNVSQCSGKVPKRSDGSLVFPQYIRNEALSSEECIQFYLSQGFTERHIKEALAEQNLPSTSSNIREHVQPLQKKLSALSEHNTTTDDALPSDTDRDERDSARKRKKRTRKKVTKSRMDKRCERQLVFRFNNEETSLLKSLRSLPFYGGDDFL